MLGTSGGHKDIVPWWLTVQERRYQPPANKCLKRGTERFLEIVDRNPE